MTSIQQFPLFIYGTLKMGYPQHGRLRGAVFKGFRTTEPRFHLLDEGNYPVMIPGGVTRVRGELYLVSKDILQKLDHYEDHPYFYRRQQLRLRGGGHAQAYVMPPWRHRREWTRIPTGIWPHEL